MLVLFCFCCWPPSHEATRCLSHMGEPQVRPRVHLSTCFGWLKRTASYASLNSGSQNSQQISSADSREGSCQLPSDQGHKALQAVQTTSEPSQVPSVIDLPQVLPNPSPDGLGGEEPSCFSISPSHRGRHLPPTQEGLTDDLEL